MDKFTKNYSAIQTIKNIVSNVTLFLINIILSYFYTPFLVNKLGNVLFGFIPLASSITNFIGIITNSLNLSSGRYFIIELEQGNQKEADHIFITTLIGTLLLISIAVPFAALLVIFAPELFQVPPEYENDVQILFIGTLAAFFITSLRLNFMVATYARNRFDLRNVVTLGARIVEILIIVILFNLREPSLLIVAVSILVAAIFAFFGDYYLWKWLLPKVSVTIKSFRTKFLKLIMGTGGWLMIYQAGAIILTNIEMLIANRTLSLELAGMYGALLVIPKNLRIMAASVGGVWGPTILSRYSRSDFEGMDKIAQLSIKLVGITMALPIGLMCGLAMPFLTIWLGPEYGQMSIVLIVMIIHLPVNLIVTPLYNIQVSLNKVVAPAIVSFGFSIANIFLASLLSKTYGSIGLAVASGVMITLSNFVFMPIYCARIMNLHWAHYIIKLFPILVATVLTSMAAYYVSINYSLNTLLDIILVGTLISIAYILIIYLVGLNRDERALIQHYLKITFQVK